MIFMARVHSDGSGIHAESVSDSGYASYCTDEERVPSMPLGDEHLHSSTLFSSIAALFSTIMGGGVLTVPYAFSKAGILLGPLMLVATGFAADFSLYLLIVAARKKASRTFEELAERTYGRALKVVVLWLLLLLTFMCVLAYMLLIRDLFSGIVEFVLGTGQLSRFERELVMVLVIVALYPLYVQQRLNQLRFTSATSVLTVLVLTACLAYRAMMTVHAPEIAVQHQDNLLSDDGLRLSLYDQAADAPIHYFPVNAWDIFHAFPLFALSYLCHFNALPVHSELKKPTMHRVKILIHAVIVLCTVFYIAIGCIGYSYARDATEGNILLSFPSDDGVILIGRAALGFTCCFNFPLLVLPAKKVLNRLLAYYLFGSEQLMYEPCSDNNTVPSVEHQNSDMNSRLSSLSPNSYFGRIYKPSSRTPMGAILHMDEPSFSSYQQNRGITATANDCVTSSIDEITDINNQSIYSEPTWSASNVLQSSGIVFSALLIAVQVRSVAVIFALMGSSVSILVTFIFPPLFYLKIQSTDRNRSICFAAWMMLAFGIVSSVLCTITAFYAVFM